MLRNNLIANNCTFIDNAGNNGASITSYYSTVKITNSTFKRSSDDIVKGHIYLHMSNATIDNCDFLNTTSKYAAAIFSNENVNLNISNSRFKNLHAYKTAGAIAAKRSARLSVSDSEFDNDASENNGGAIFVDANGSEEENNPMDSTITRTTFNNCYSGFGGAILQLGGKLIISASNFTNNKAKYEGGGLYTSHVSAQIQESLFKSNSVADDISYGGAAYFDMGSVRISDSRFEKISVMTLVLSMVMKAI